MMTMKQIIALLKCSRWKAMKMLSEAGIKPTIVPSRSKSNNGGGIKHVYDLTAAKVLELKDTGKPSQDQVVAQQGRALSALEAAFGTRRI